MSFYTMYRQMVYAVGLCILVFSLTVLSSGNAAAHRMKVFAWVDGSMIGGEAYFMGGELIANATIELLADQQVIETTQSDNDGQFIFAEVIPKDYQVRADAGQGHVATFSIAQSEFSIDTQPATHTLATATVIQASTAAIGSLTAKQLEDAIAKAIRPLRAEIDQYEAKLRLHDVLGGIGYIFGLFGFWNLMRTRR